MAIISSGQITIIDLYDVPSLNAWISSGSTTAQTYNNTAQTWTPNYPTEPQVLTLNLTKAGSATSLLGTQVTNVRWTKKVGTSSTEITSTTSADVEYKSGTSNSILTTKSNVPVANNAVLWSVDGIWNDPDSGIPVAFSADIQLTLVQLAKAAIIGNIYAPKGDFFRNNTPTSLMIKADLYKDGTLSAGSKKFKWFAEDTSVNTSQDTDGGVGWRKIIATSGTSGEFASSGFDVEVTTQGTLTVFPNAVVNGQTYKVVITDNAGGTIGTKVTNYITLRDMDDPIMVVVESSAGTILKNGAGSTTLTARLFQNGDVYDSGGTLHTYKWTRWQGGSIDSNFGGTGINFKTGRTLAVGSNDVDIKTVFKVEVS